MLCTVLSAKIKIKRCNRPASLLKAGLFREGIPSCYQPHVISPTLFLPGRTNPLDEGGGGVVLVWRINKLKLEEMKGTFSVTADAREKNCC